MSIRFFLFYSFLLIYGLVTAQKNIENTGYTSFQIADKKDSIEFIIADTSFQHRKPILLFCQGSQPVPLFVNVGNNQIVEIALSNFDLEKMKEKYYVVVISQPHTPLIANIKQLNQNYAYITDSTRQHSYSKKYLNADFMENHVYRANRVIRFLNSQKWIDKTKLIVMGHSQGARIAVGIAKSNRKVTRLGLFGYNPLGRIDTSIRQARKDAESGKITWEQADSITQNTYSFMEEIQHPDTLIQHPNLVSWNSFSKSTMFDLLSLDIPIYIAYGSHDIVADLCDLLPILFTEKEKQNLTIHRYSQLEHNFFPILENGEIDYQNGRWKEIMNDFIEWTWN